MIRTLVTAALGVAVSTVALVGSADAAPTIVGPLYQEQISATCNGKSSCEVLFTAVPVGKVLVITDIGCVITMSSSASVVATSMSGRNAANTIIARTVYPRADLISIVSGTKRYQSQTEVQHFLVATEKPRMFVGASAAPADFITMCSISGLLQ